MSLVGMKKIEREYSVQEWLESEACKRLLHFLKRICDAVKGKKNTESDGILIERADEREVIVRREDFLGEITFVETTIYCTGHN